MTLQRTVPYFKTTIQPILGMNNNIIISAHGNSIRSIVMYLLSISEKDILKTEIGWCEPWIFTLLEDGAVKSLDIHCADNKISDSFLPQQYEIKK